MLLLTGENDKHRDFTHGNKDMPGIEIYAKAEWKNSGGSVKSRPALQMIEDADHKLISQEYDDLRRALMWEPRGHADMYGCLVGPPATAEAGLFAYSSGTADSWAASISMPAPARQRSAGQCRARSASRLASSGCPGSL